jgi:hypothetical protein
MYAVVDRLVVSTTRPPKIAVFRRKVTSNRTFIRKTAILSGTRWSRQGSPALGRGR